MNRNWKFFLRRCSHCNEQFRVIWDGWGGFRDNNSPPEAISYLSDAYFFIAPFRWTICQKCEKRKRATSKYYENWMWFRLLSSIFLSIATTMGIMVLVFYSGEALLPGESELNFLLAFLVGSLALLRVVYSGVFTREKAKI